MLGGSFFLRTAEFMAEVDGCIRKTGEAVDEVQKLIKKNRDRHYRHRLFYCLLLSAQHNSKKLLETIFDCAIISKNRNT